MPPNPVPVAPIAPRRRPERVRARASRRRSRCVAISAWLVCCGLFGFTSAAELVDAPAELSVPPEGPLSLAIAARQDRAVRLQLERSPLGIELERGEDGGWTLVWPDPDRRFDATVVLSAAPADDLRARERVTIELRAPERASEVPTREIQPERSESPGSPRESLSESAQSAPSAATPGPLTLPDVSPQTLAVGRAWELWLRADGLPADRVDLSLRDAPPGMTLTAGVDGWYRLGFVPRERGSIDVEVVANARQDAAFEARSRIRLNVGDGEASVADAAGPDEPGMERSMPESLGDGRGASADDAMDDEASEGADDEADDAPAPLAPNRRGDTEAALPLDRLLEAPRLRPISNHVVSAGRAVRFRVRPRIADGQRAIVQIDRLPRNASFDENDDGSRTFHWPTADRDQGEHRFRLTALNAEDASLRDQIEVTVIVGDPTRGKSVPAELTQP